MTFQEKVSAITLAQAKTFLQDLPATLHIAMCDPLNCLGARLIKHVTGVKVSVGVDAGYVQGTEEEFETPAWLAQVIRTAINTSQGFSRHTPPALLELIAQQEDGNLLSVTLLPEPVAADPIPQPVR